VLINSLDRKFKAYLSKFQAVEFARAADLQKYYSNRRSPVIKNFIAECMDLSGSIDGRNMKAYVDVGSVRVAVNDRKRKMELEQNSV